MSSVPITIKQLLNEKGNDVCTIAPDKTVYEALEMMADKNVGALIVLEEGAVVGIFSERDYARKVVLKGKLSKEALIRDMMTTEVCYVTPEKNIEECMALFSNKHIRHLPVLENDQLVGIISIGDAVNKIISEQKFEISELENYISGVSAG